MHKGVGPLALMELSTNDTAKVRCMTGKHEINIKSDEYQKSRKTEQKSVMSSEIRQGPRYHFSSLLHETRVHKGVGPLALKE